MTKLWVASLLLLVGCQNSYIVATPQQVASRCNKTTDGEHTDPGLACYQAERTLPTAIQFGDSVSVGYSIEARHDLCGVVDYRHDDWDADDVDLCGEAHNHDNHHLVVLRATNNGYSTTMLSDMEAQLTHKHFNVLLFNSGYHDVQHYSNIAALNVSQSDYRNNLETISHLCEQSADICIWIDTPELDAASLPLPPYVVDNSDVARYNTIAREVAKEHGFYMLSVPSKEHDGTVHFTFPGYVHVGALVANCVITALHNGNTADCHK